MTDAQFVAWLKDSSAIRCVLIEVNVKTGGAETTRFLSNKGYVTSPTDTPANTRYSPFVVGGIKFTETLSLEGTASLSYGDIEIDNLSGDRDTWLDDVWANRAIKVYIGDVRWIRSDFRLIFDGIVANIDTKNRGKLNLKISDKLQRLNAPITENKLGGVGENADRLLPLCFGECHNVEPLLVNAVVNEYQVHDGAIESIIEVRDNGVPVAFTPFLTTGKFRLAAQPSGQITASVQGALVANPNLAQHTEDITQGSVWFPVGITPTANTMTSPYGTATADKLTRLTTGSSYISQLYSDPATKTFTLSVFAHAAITGGFFASRIQGTYPHRVDAVFDLTTGTVKGSLGVSGATLVAASMVDAGSGWWRCILTGTLTGVAQYLFAPCDSAASISGWEATSAVASDCHVWGTQFELGSVATEYKGNGATRSTPVYLNTVARVCLHVATNYGNATNRLSYAECDLQDFALFDAANPQPVGIYANERTNVIEALNKLAASVGGRVMIDRSGKLSLVKLNLPQATAGTTVTPTDIVEQSLAVSQMPTVDAGVQIGYCKNWTVEATNIAAGVPVNHADLYKQEWLTITRTDSVAQADYKTFVEPVMEETLLLTNADAVAEANRRLAMWSVQRKAYKYIGMPWLMLETLGAAQTIKNSRFGLTNGKTGQIISLATDWLNPHITVEVLI